MPTKNFNTNICAVKNSENCEISDYEKEDGRYLARQAEPDTEIKSQTIIGDVNVMCQTENIHLGTHITFNGPVTISCFSNKDLKKINERCFCENEEYKLTSEIKKHRKLIEIKKELIRNWNKKKCFILGLTITLTEVIILILHFFIFRSEKKIESPDVISLSALKEINSNLVKFTPRNDWGEDHECTFECGVKVKRKIKFIVIKSFWADCYVIDNCQRSLIGEFKRNMKNDEYPFNDIYYNYIINAQGDIYEGRSLHCPFDEPFLPESHSSIITVGIPLCFIGVTHVYEVNSQNVYKAIINMLNSFIAAGILDKKYTLEFPDTCQSNLFLRKLSENNVVTFYEHKNDLYNVSSHLNPDVMNNLLFIWKNSRIVTLTPIITDRKTVTATNIHHQYKTENETVGEREIYFLNTTYTDSNRTGNGYYTGQNYSDDGNTSSSIITITRRDKLHPPLPSSLILCENNTEWFRSTHVDRITILLGYNTAPYRSNCGIPEECWAGDEGVYNLMFDGDEPDPERIKRINYLVLLPADAVYELASINCSLKDVIKSEVVITILILDTYATGDAEEKIESLSELFLPIVNDVKSNVNYSKVHFQLLCDSVLIPMMYLYEIFTNDMSYMTEEGNQTFTKSSCWT